MKVLYATVVVALLAGPAYAQSGMDQNGHMQGYHEESQPKTATEIRADRAAEKAYKDSLGNIPDSGPVDPWGNARGAGAPKDAAKTTAKPVAKTAAKAAPVKPKTATTPAATTAN
jgi:hypothetical protein